MRSGIDIIASYPKRLQGLGRLGLVVNQTSTNLHFRTSAEILYEAAQKNKGVSVGAVFGPQHGYGQTEQDNMRETPDGFFSFSDGKRVPLFSLYSKTRTPTKEQLEHVDTLIVDLQDLGCRVYTYMLTLAGCLRSAAEFGKKVVVLDRENPLGLSYLNKQSNKWERVEGNQLQTKFHSFVGWYDIPLRHGLSMGELGRYFISKDKLKVDYDVVRVEGLYRNSPLNVEHRKPWTMPSPNIPDFLSAFLFPAFVMLEGANVSEGRGTTIPFQLIGAPWLDVEHCIEFLKKNENLYCYHKEKSSGLVMRRHDFRPTFNKYMGEICKGIQFHMEEANNLNLFHLGLLFLTYCSLNHPNDFQWSKPGYEYNFTDLPIHLILGSDDFTGFLNNNRAKNSQTEKNTLRKELPQSFYDKDLIDEFQLLLNNFELEAQNFAITSSSFFLYEEKAIL